MNAPMKSFLTVCNGILLALRTRTPEDSFQRIRELPTFTATMIQVRKTRGKNGTQVSESDQESYLDEYESRIDNFLHAPAISKLPTVERYKLLSETHFDGGDMDKRIRLAVITLDEAKAFHAVKKFDGASCLLAG